MVSVRKDCRSYCLFTGLRSAAACSETSARQNTSTGRIKPTFERYLCPVESVSSFFFLFFYVLVWLTSPGFLEVSQYLNQDQNLKRGCVAGFEQSFK